MPGPDTRVEDGPDYDVIIAGAGPVGLFLASELRLAKRSVLVLERAEDPRAPLKRLPFGMRGLWGRTDSRAAASRVPMASPRRNAPA